MIEKTKGRRPKPAEMRKVHVNTSMTLEQREMFLTLGGSAWLQKQMDALLAKTIHMPADIVAKLENWKFNPETNGWSLE